MQPKYSAIIIVSIYSRPCNIPISTIEEHKHWTIVVMSFCKRFVKCK